MLLAQSAFQRWQNRSAALAFSHWNEVAQVCLPSLSYVWQIDDLCHSVKLLPLTPPPINHTCWLKSMLRWGVIDSNFREKDWKEGGGVV